MDYFNPAPQPPEPAKVNLKLLIIGGVVGLLVLILVVYVFSALQAQKNAASSPLPLVARLQKLSTITTDYHGKLRSSALQDVNSSLKLVLQTANHGITEPLKAYNIDIKKSAKQISAIEANSTAELTKRLDDAYLNITFDDTYTREIIYELEGAEFMMNRLLRTTQSANMKGFIESTMKDLESLKKRFTEVQRS